MLVDVNGGPFFTNGPESEFLFTVGARVTVRVAGEHEYIWTAGVSWNFPHPCNWPWWFWNGELAEHTANATLFGFRLYVTWW